MTSTGIRAATAGDIAGICRFGEEHIPPLYTPLIGAEAAREQLRFWTEAQIARAVTRNLMVVATRDDEIVGVGQRGRRDPAADSDHVIYKLYLHPGVRGQGIGPRLIEALSGQIDADRIYVEHFRENERAARFYEREGFKIEREENGIVWRSRPITRP
ncbi:GNAT family N-acetyltransferase [Lentzea sp. NPDC006480]|uniref:GNAT family N-acetyltransferase n=1 Tax=Lentzea sp. NPDC006480 TaxID=3157176 RepID=UPI0033A5B81B